MRRSAVTARLRVEAARRRLRRLPGGSCQAVTLVSSSCSLSLDFADHAFQVGEDLLVHLQHAACPLDLETSIRVSVR